MKSIQPTQRHGILSRWNAKLGWRSAQYNALPYASEFSILEDRFFSVFFEVQKQTQTSLIAQQWFSHFVTQKFLKSWLSVRELVNGISATSTRPSPSDRAVITALVIAILGKLDCYNAPLSQIVGDLMNDGLLRKTVVDGSHKHNCSLVAQIIDCFTFTRKFRQDFSENDRRATGMVTGKSPARSSRISLNKDQLKLEFSEPIIRFLQEESGSGSYYISQKLQDLGITGPTAKESTETIERSFVCFRTLTLIGNIRIIWTEHLGSHLKFDPSTRLLSVFRFPSYCFLAHQAEQGSSSRSLRNDSNHLGDLDIFPEGFFEEVLLSYHLLFGGRSSQKKNLLVLPSDQYADPLLEIICSNDWKNEAYQQIYEDNVISRETFMHFSIKDNFRFFGGRLLQLQNYMGPSNPHSFFELWHDRRDIGYWWSFWAVIIIGGMTCVFAVISNLLQFYQVYHARQQLQPPLPSHNYTTPLPGTPIQESQPQSATSQLLRHSFERLLVFISVGKRAIFRRIGSVAVLVAVILDLICLTLVAALAYPALRAKTDINPRSGLRSAMTKKEWQCHCGEIIHEDFFVVGQNTSSLLNDESSTQLAPANHDLELQDDPATIRSQWWRIAFHFLWYFINTGSNGSRDNEQDENKGLPPGSFTHPKSLPPAEDLFLSACIEKPNGSIALVQMNVAGIISDRDLFACLREHHLSIRGRWLPMLKFRRLDSINFVQFELWPSDEVDIQPFYDHRCLPPPENREYKYEAAPTLPPISSARLMHFWKTPNHRDGDGETCLGRFPKRKLERLYVSVGDRPAVGWGIQLSEGLDWFLLWMLIFVVVLIGSLVFGVAFAVLQHDIQSAFSVASYVVSFATLGIGALSICGQRMVDRYYT